jgi:hypothetical protein
MLLDRFEGEIDFNLVRVYRRVPLITNSAGNS